MIKLPDEIAKDRIEIGITAVGDNAAHVFVKLKIHALQNARRAHGHAVQIDIVIREKLGGLVCPLHDVVSVQRAEADVGSVAFPVRTHMDVYKVAAERFIKIVHCRKIAGGLGLVAVEKDHRFSRAAAAQHVRAQGKPVVRNDAYLVKRQLAEWPKVGDVVCPERLSGRLKQGR